jgi:phage-related baseplate assembly protein
VLARESEECPDALDAVNGELSDDKVRPLTDKVIIHAATMVHFDIRATIMTYPGSDSVVVLAESRRRLDDHLSEHQKLEYDISRSAICAALHSPGVQDVELIEPTENLRSNFTAAARCDAIELTYSGVNV